MAVVPLPPGAAEVGGGAEATATERVGDGGQREASTKEARIDWARLLWRVSGVDALQCPACDGRIKMIAAVTERVGIVRILEHLGVSTEMPRMRRVRDGR